MGVRTVILMLILLQTALTRQIGSINHYFFNYDPPADNLTTTIMYLDNISPCSECVCAALMSSVNYVAVNCFKNLDKCTLLSASINVTDIVSNVHSSLYILSYASVPMDTTTANAATSLDTTVAFTDTQSTSSIGVTTATNDITTPIVSTTQTSVTTSTTTSTTTTTTTTSCLFNALLGHIVCIG